MNSRPLLLPALAVLALGCGSPDAEVSQTPPSGPELQAEPAPGHPSLDSTAPQGMVVPPDPQAGTGVNALTWTTPESWESVPPSSSMRRAQYRVPGPAGDAECVVFYFGPGQGGEALPNATRWAGQFTKADGSLAHDQLQTRDTEVNGVHVLLAEVSGTWDGGTMRGQPQHSLSGYMLLGAVAEGPDANWFFKLTGPEETVEANRQAFEETLVGSLRPGISEPTA